MVELPDEKTQPLFLPRHKVCTMLGITKREFHALIAAGKLHPVQTALGHNKIPLAEVISLKAEYAARALSTPYEKFVRAATWFCASSMEVNAKLTILNLPKAPVEYLERLRVVTQKDPDPALIKAESAHDFFTMLGRAEEILKRPDLRLLVELLHMVNRGEEEIRQTLLAKYGRDFGVEDVARYIEYFYNWRVMDPDSVKFYFDFLQGREKLLKECAYRRADYFIFYALGIDFGGEVADLLERSCLGLLHKLNIFVDGYVYGDLMVTQNDIQKMADIISTLLGAASQMRAGRIPKGKQREVVDALVPAAYSREAFFAGEKSASFKAPENAS